MTDIKTVANDTIGISENVVVVVTPVRYRVCGENLKPPRIPSVAKSAAFIL